MAATANFLNAWRRSGRQASVLVQIVVPDGVNLGFTFRASTGLVTTPNTPTNFTWEPLLVDVEPVMAPGSFGETGIQLCSCRMTLANRKMGWQTNDPIKSRADIAYTLHDRTWVGARVTMWLWESSLVSFNDALQIFSGTVQTVEPSIEKVVLVLKQRTNWNKTFPAYTVEPLKYSRAASSAYGQPEPVVYGRNLGPKLVQPHASPYSVDQRYLEMIRRPRAAVQSMVGDIGAGNNKVKIVVAGHPIINLSDPAQGTAVWTEVDGHMCRAAIVTAGNLVDTATQVGILLDVDNPFQAAVKLAEIASTTTARNANTVLDPNGISFAAFDFGQNQKLLKVVFGTQANLGDIHLPANVGVVVCYEAVSLTGGGFSISGQYADGSTALAATNLPATTGSPSTVVIPSNFSLLVNWSEYLNASLTVQFTGTPLTGRAKVYFVGIISGGLFRQVVSYAHGVKKPQSARPQSLPDVPDKKGSPSGRPVQSPFQSPYLPDRKIAVYSTLESDFYCNAIGWEDGSPGPLINAPGALVERGGDIFAHIMHQYAGDQIGGAVEGGLGGTFGSFYTAADDLKDWRGQDMIYAAGFGESQDIDATIAMLCGCTFAWAYINRFNDRWHFIPWKMDRQADYSITFTPKEVLEPVPETSSTPFGDVTTGWRFNYNWDAQQKAYRDVVEVGPGRSNAGYEYINCRDEDTLGRPGVSDTIDFSVNGVVFAAVLTSAVSQFPQILARDTQAAMRTAASNNNIWVGHHGTIYTNVNGCDNLYWNTASLSYNYTIPGGTYTMEQLAAQVQTGMNSVGPGGFTVTYSRTTRKFTIAKTAAFTLYANSQPALQKVRSAWPQLGFLMNTDYGGGPASVSSSVAVEEQRFYFACNQSLKLLWESGAAGSAVNGRQCASLFGFDPKIDMYDGPDRHFIGYSPKGVRESTANAAGLPPPSGYGARRMVSRDLRFVSDNTTARELRNRYFDAFIKPRVRITFTTNHAPDLERGRVIDFSSEFDKVMSYPGQDTDGSWAGKNFVVVETEQHMGPTAFYTRVTAISLG